MYTRISQIRGKKRNLHYPVPSTASINSPEDQIYVLRPQTPFGSNSMKPQLSPQRPQKIQETAPTEALSPF